MEKKNNKIMKHSFEEVTQLDNAILHLATYNITKGLLLVPKNAEDVIAMHEKVANKFNEFKYLIQRGECSLEDIKHNVLSEYGPFKRVKEPTIDEVLSVKDKDNELTVTEVTDEDIKKVATSLSKIFKQLPPPNKTDSLPMYFDPPPDELK
jgi:hypothetical protein